MNRFTSFIVSKSLLYAQTERGVFIYFEEISLIMTDAKTKLLPGKTGTFQRTFKFRGKN